jgi:hypothetical protein
MNDLLVTSLLTAIGILILLFAGASLCSRLNKRNFRNKNSKGRYSKLYSDFKKYMKRNKEGLIMDRKEAMIKSLNHKNDELNKVNRFEAKSSIKEVVEAEPVAEVVVEEVPVIVETVELVEEVAPVVEELVEVVGEEMVELEPEVSEPVVEAVVEEAPVAAEVVEQPVVSEEVVAIEETTPAEVVEEVVQPTPTEIVK